MDISPERLKQVAEVATQNISWPVRDPSYVSPSFWSQPLNITRCRPLVSGGGWLDAITIPQRNGLKAKLCAFDASSQVAGGVEYRWLRNDSLVDPDSLQLDAAVEYNIDRFAANPYPLKWRRIHLVALSNDNLRLQVRNTSGNTQLVFAGVWGWYYPDLQNPNEITAMEGIDDVVRDF